VECLLLRIVDTHAIHVLNRSCKQYNFEPEVILQFKLFLLIILTEHDLIHGCRSW